MKKFVNVTFSDGHNPFKSYNYLTDIQDLKRGDKVVVDTVNGFKIAEVEEYIELPNPAIKNFKWIVQKVDLTSHQERIENERRVAALKRKMESRYAELKEVQIYAMMAREDEAMRQMLEEFTSLTK